MLADIQYMHKGQLYRIKNRKTGLYLTSGPQITCTPYYLGRITQYWLCDQIKPTMYEIVSLQSGQVLTRNQTLNIQKGKWGSNQFWSLFRAQIAHDGNYFWIIGQDNQDKYLFATAGSDKVAMKNLDRTLFVSNWKFQRIDDTEQLAGCCVFRSMLSQMVIDVPQGSNKDGVSIIQYPYNGRGNQRWVIQSLKGQYIIRNICSNLILCPSNRTLKQGTKIIQTQFINNLCEKWIIQKKDKEHFTIHNAGDRKLLIGVSSIRQNANLILSADVEKCVWKLEGNVPHIKEMNIEMEQK